MNRVCLGCGVSINAQHFNRKRCERCAAELVARPKGHLTKSQEASVRRLAGSMRYEDLAVRVGCSRSNLMRWARDNGVSLNSHSYKADVIAKVCSYYEKHGRLATSKKFPDVKIRSVVERYKDFSPRQERWTDDQIVEAAKMAGLVSPAAQARFFKRPNAHSGAIRSLWMKRFGFGQASLNGMMRFNAKHFVTSSARYLNPVGETRIGKPTQFRRLILWVDMEKCLKDDTPQFVGNAVRALADFQRWIWKSENPKPLILKMIKEREGA